MKENKYHWTEKSESWYVWWNFLTMPQVHTSLHTILFLASLQRWREFARECFVSVAGYLHRPIFGLLTAKFNTMDTITHKQTLISLVAGLLSEIIELMKQNCV